MASALFIVLEREIRGIDPLAVDGRFLARNTEMLDALARKLGVRTVSEFISIDPAEVSEFLEGEGINASELSLPSEQWFASEEGLRTFSSLQTSLRSVHAVDPRLVNDLQNCEVVLAAAHKDKVSFHLAVDF